MTALIDRARGGRPYDSGASLVELLVTLVVTAIVMSIVGSFFIQSVKTTTNSNQTRTTTSQASNVITAAANPIRVATPIVSDAGYDSLGTTAAIYSASASKAVLFAYLGAPANATTPVPSKVTIEVAAGRLIVTTCGLTKNGAGVYAASSCVSPAARSTGSTITNPGSFFAYNDETGSPISFVNGTIPSARLKDIYSVTINARVQAPGSFTGALELQNTVTMPNVGFGSVSS